MTTSQLVKHLRALGVEVVMRGARFTVRNPKALPAWLLQTVSAHSAALKRFLIDGLDQELTPVIAKHTLRRLGFVQLENGRWSHPDGDHVGEQIVVGLISDADARARVERARKEAIALGATPDSPKAVPVNDLRELYPGRWRWSETEGQLHKDPFPRITRIAIDD